MCTERPDPLRCGQPLNKGQKGISRCVRYSEVLLYSYKCLASVTYVIAMVSKPYFHLCVYMHYMSQKNLKLACRYTVILHGWRLIGEVN